jgi:hypothetical protein
MPVRVPAAVGVNSVILRVHSCLLVLRLSYDQGMNRAGVGCIHRCDTKAIIATVARRDLTLKYLANAAAGAIWPSSANWTHAIAGRG